MKPVYVEIQNEVFAGQMGTTNFICESGWSMSKNDIIELEGEITPAVVNIEDVFEAFGHNRTEYIHNLHNIVFTMYEDEQKIRR